MHDLFSLHKYFIYQNTIRLELERYFKKQKLSNSEEKYRDSYIQIYLDLWYWTFYVLIEWYQELNIQDIKINKLLESFDLKLLKRYRNWVFHFQKDWYDDRFEKLHQSDEFVLWSENLLKEFRRYFLEQIKLWKVIAPKLPKQQKDI